MATTFNIFDLIFAVGSFIFILVAFFRGFVKELFALLNWVITISLSYLLAPYAAKFVESYSHNKLIINVASGSMVFVVIFIIVVFSTRGLAHDWKEKMPENIDRILGIFYGVFKSLLIFGLFYSITLNFYSILLGDANKTEAQISESSDKSAEKKTSKTKKENLEQDLPNWLTQAKCFAIVKFAGDVINPLVSKAIDGTTKNLLDEIKPEKIDLNDKIDEVIDNEKKGLGDDVGGSAGALAEKKSVEKASEKSEDTGYSKKEIEKMNRLIEIVN